MHIDHSVRFIQRRFPLILNAKPLDVSYDFHFVFQWACAVMRSRYTVPPGKMAPVGLEPSETIDT
jgi:hypothetical protein